MIFTGIELSWIIAGTQGTGERLNLPIFHVMR